MQITDRLSTLWIVIMFNMAFADILGFIDPATLSEIATASTEGVSFGNIENVVITPSLLLVAAVFIQVAIAMIYLSKALPRRANRIVNTVAALLTSIFILGGGSLSPHYIFFASIEILCLGYIVILVWRWSDL
jgi:hypothetical protein